MSTTVFNKTNFQWEGLGINTDASNGVRLPNFIDCTMLNYARFHVKTSINPGNAGIYYDNAAFDNLWLTSDDILNGNSRFTYSELVSSGTNIIFTIGDDFFGSASPMDQAPITTFLGNNGLNTLNGDSLLAYARFFVSAIYVHNSLGMPITWIDLLQVEVSECNNGRLYISPQNYIILIQTVKSLLSQRNITGIKIMGPTISHVISQGDTIDPYITIFQNTTLIDAWSFIPLEPYIDKNVYNKGDLSARIYMYTEISKTINLMQITIPEIPIFITNFSTNATRYSYLCDYSAVASESVEYALRMMDNLCSIINSGGSCCIFWYITRANDHYALYRENNTSRPIFNCIENLSHVFFVPNEIGLSVYTNGDVYPFGDETFKAVVANDTMFSIILSRPIATDLEQGSQIIQINNSNWTGSNYNISLQFFSFPEYISVLGIQYTAVVSNGSLLLSLTNVPYNCCVFIKGGIYPIIPITPSIQYKNINIEQVSSYPVSPVSGKVIYYIPTSTVYVYNSSTLTWIPITL